MIVFILRNCSGLYSNCIARAVEDHGCPTTLVSWKDFDFRLVNKFNFEKDIIFFRTGAPAAVQIARAFEDAGFYVVNDSRYLQLSGNKYLANVHATSSGVPIPTLNVKVRKGNKELLSLYLKQNGPLVAKPVISCDNGRHVYLVRTEADFSDVARIPGSHILLQDYVRFHRLVRTIVTSAGMLAEATTYATAHDMWKAAVKNRSVKHYRDIPKELQNIAEKTLQVFGGDLAFIDFFETSNGFIFNEINHACGLLQHERISGCPIASNLGRFLANRFRLSPTRALITNVMENSAIAGPGQAPGERETLAGGATWARNPQALPIYWARGRGQGTIPGPKASIISLGD